MQLLLKKGIVFNVIQLVAVAVKYTKSFDKSRTFTNTKATFSNAQKPLLLQTVVVRGFIHSNTITL
ncbi:MAG: hypothetical protein RL259_113 [Bacteroidota bacterium]